MPGILFWRTGRTDLNDGSSESAWRDEGRGVDRANRTATGVILGQDSIAGLIRKTLLKQSNAQGLSVLTRHGRLLLFFRDAKNQTSARKRFPGWRKRGCWPGRWKGWGGGESRDERGPSHARYNREGGAYRASSVPRGGRQHGPGAQSHFPPRYS